MQPATMDDGRLVADPVADRPAEQRYPLLAQDADTQHQADHPERKAEVVRHVAGEKREQHVEAHAVREHVGDRDLDRSVKRAERP
jgi:hypothetical protein